MIGAEIKFDFFISHSKETKMDIAIPIAQALSSMGFRVWLDRKNLSVGEQIYSNIRTAIDDTKYCVAIIDKSYLKRTWTLDEINCFRNKDSDNIIPIYVDLEKEIVYKTISWMEGIAFEKMGNEIFNFDKHLEILCRILGRFYSDHTTYTSPNIFNDIAKYSFPCKETFLALVKNREYYSSDLRIAIIELCNIGGIVYAIYVDLCRSPNLIIETMFRFSTILRDACFNAEYILTYNMYIAIYKAVIASTKQLKAFFDSI